MLVAAAVADRGGRRRAEEQGASGTNAARDSIPPFLQSVLPGAVSADPDFSPWGLLLLNY